MNGCLAELVEAKIETFLRISNIRCVILAGENMGADVRRMEVADRQFVARK